MKTLTAIALLFSYPALATPMSSNLCADLIEHKAKTAQVLNTSIEVKDDSCYINGSRISHFAPCTVVTQQAAALNCITASGAKLSFDSEGNIPSHRALLLTQKTVSLMNYGQTGLAGKGAVLAQKLPPLNYQAEFPQQKTVLRFSPLADGRYQVTDKKQNETCASVYVTSHEVTCDDQILLQY